MKRLKVLVLLFGLIVATGVAAQDDPAGECTVSYLFNAWARPTAEAAPTGAVYGQLVHIGGMADTLVSASTDVAETVELHEIVMGADDVMQMHPMEGGFMVPPNSFLQLKPGGFHMMLIGLKQTLAMGDHFDLTLNFEQAGAVTVTVPVQDMPAMVRDAMGSDAMQSDAMGTMSEMDTPMMDWGTDCAGVYFLDPWVRPAVPGAPNSAAYGLLVNLTDTDETLVSASTDIAETVELHEMVIGADDVMQMRPVEGGIVVPAGGATLLQPGGLHIMLLNLGEPLPDGATVDFTLSFANNADLAFSAPVREPEMDSMSMGK